MTELQIAIGHLKETISVGNVLLAKLEQQEEAEKSKSPKFPARFVAVKDSIIEGDFVIGMVDPRSWPELPHGFLGRACFSEKDIRQIITGLQTLLGDSNG